jgi:hypothetical protein
MLDGTGINEYLNTTPPNLVDSFSALINPIRSSFFPEHRFGSQCSKSCEITNDQYTENLEWSILQRTHIANGTVRGLGSVGMSGSTSGVIHY